MSFSTIEGEFLGTEPTPGSIVQKIIPPNSGDLTAVLSNGVEASVGMTVYFTLDGAKKIVGDMFKAVDAQNVNDLIVKAAGLFGQKVSSEQVSAVTSKVSEQINSLSQTPILIIGIPAQNRLNIQFGADKRSLSNIPSSFFFSKEEGWGSVLNSFNRKYGSIPVWGWSLIGIGAVGAGVATVYAIRKR